MLFLKVNYQSGVEANLGNELTPTQVKDVPQVSWNAEEDQFYTLVLTGRYNLKIIYSKSNKYISR